MVRDGLYDDAPHASMVLATNGTAEWLQRDAAGDSTTSVYRTPSDSWFKLTKSGDTLTGYDSNDGLTWTQVSSATLSMTGPVYIGLVANSGNTTDGQTVAFDNVMPARTHHILKPPHPRPPDPHTASSAPTPPFPILKRLPKDWSHFVRNF
ncbi:MAG TPA: hypothetical protein VH253_08200 [Phycisphaerae bacterium]|nr:hypothetical protein [Phycisphaerae bacterium]